LKALANVQRVTGWQVNDMNIGHLPFTNIPGTVNSGVDISIYPKNID
jgi:hypothetical protein